MRDSQRGFTLVEVLVALALSGLVLLSAHALLTGVGDRAHALALSADTLSTRAIGARTLRQLVGQLEVGTPASGPFAG
ncbi:MAG: PulJ/GspJ family protein, partial [Gemmatimonadaceae bacterium]